jgi:hypothetical protein
MKTPGFTAEAAVYKKNGSYRTARAYGSAAPPVYPAARPWAFILWVRVPGLQVRREGTVSVVNGISPNTL